MLHMPRNLCFQFTDWLKRVLNLVSLDSDLSVSEEYVSQTLGSETPNTPWQPVPGLPPHLHSSTQGLQRSRLGSGVLYLHGYSTMFYVLCVVTAVIVFSAAWLI